MKEITLLRGQKALVDDADYEWLHQWTWHLHDTGCAVRSAWHNGTNHKVRMHREIVNAPKGVEVDHKDGNKLNNTRANLRLASRTENQCNVRKRKTETTSLYKGVWWHAQKGKWVATIWKDKRHHHLGLYEDEKCAAVRYDAAALELHGDFASTNFSQQELKTLIPQYQKQFKEKHVKACP